MQTIMVGSGQGASKLVSAGDPATLINNGDVANTIWLGDTAQISSADLNNVIGLSPGQSVSSDGSQDIFGTCSIGQTAVAQLITGVTSITLSEMQAQLIAANLAKETGGNLAGINLGVGPLGLNGYLGGTLAGALVATPGSTVAKDVSKTGAPGLRFTNNQGFNAPGVTLTPGLGVVLVNNQPVNQMGYEAVFFLYLPSSSGALPFANVIVEWFDAASGLAVEADFFVLSAGNGSANGLTYYLSGPCKGDIMNMQIIDLDPVTNMTLQYTVNQNSHIYTRDRLIQPVYAAVAPNGFTNPNGTPALGQLAVASPTIGPGAISSRLLAVYNGRVGINVDARAQANNVSYKLVDPQALYGATPNGEFWSQDTPAGGSQIYQEIALPNGPVQLSVTNRGGTGNVAPMVSITKLEY